MIEYKQNVFREGDLAVKTMKVTFFGITLFSARITSTSSQAVSQLTVKTKQTTKIVGFK